jgi:uncharacterized membrane protein
MASNKHEFRTAVFDDGTCAVLRTDPTKPRLMEVIATFHDAARARDYVRFENGSSDEHQEKRPVIKQTSAAKPKQTSAVKPKRASLAKPKPAAAAKPRQATEAKLKRASEAKPLQAPVAKPPQVAAPRPKQASEAKPSAVATDVSERQGAVLKALRSLMDKKNRVEVTKAELAKAASIPSGSLHSVLVSLGKKGMIRTERQGSAQFRAIYEVVETSRKSTRSLNGVVDDKEARAKTLQPTR